MTRRDGVFPFYVAREFTTIQRRDQLVERVPDATNRQRAQLRADVQISGQKSWKFRGIYHYLPRHAGILYHISDNFNRVSTGRGDLPHPAAK